MSRVTHITVNCPCCGALLQITYDPGDPLLYTCCECECEFNMRAQDIRDYIANRDSHERHVSRPRWNGFTDPHDYPTDGLDDSGW